MAFCRNGYYYKTSRVNGRVVTDYLGAGEIGETLAYFENALRAQKQAQRDEEKARRQADADLDRELDSVADLINTITKAVLIISGYHTHQRNWRKKRKVKNA